MDEKLILLGHGSGGGLSHELIEGLFVRYFGNPLLLPLEDASTFRLPSGKDGLHHGQLRGKAPLFPGRRHRPALRLRHGQRPVDARGPAPLFERGVHHRRGFAVADLERIVVSMSEAAAEAGVSIVCGDTKVVERHAADGLFINTAGVGVVPDGREHLRAAREAGRRRDRERDYRGPRRDRPEPAAGPPFQKPRRERRGAP